MKQTASTILASADLYTDNIEYAVIRLPAKAITLAAATVAEIGEPLLVLIADKDEVTLVIPSEAVEDFQTRLHDFPQSPQKYRLITFNIELDFDLIGFMALVSTALANAGVSILPIAAFSRDHILVPANQIDTALNALQRLKSASQS